VPRLVAAPEERTAEEPERETEERATPVRPVELDRVLTLPERVEDAVPARRVAAPVLRETRDTVLPERLPERLLEPRET
jgi:hypothetical protein